MPGLPRRRMDHGGGEASVSSLTLGRRRSLIDGHGEQRVAEDDMPLVMPHDARGLRRCEIVDRDRRVRLEQCRGVKQLVHAGSLVCRREEQERSRRRRHSGETPGRRQ
jgi:hypothetical protein